MDPWLFEDNLQNVCFTGLTDRGIPHGTTRGNVENAQDRVEVVASGFRQASSKMAQSSGGTWFATHYEGSLAFAVITQVAGAHAANHNVWVSNVRAMMARPAQFFTANNLPCYNVLRVEQVADDSEQDPRTDAHHTPLTFLVGLEIIGSQVP
jgi:L-fucose isomerase-like protein